MKAPPNGLEVNDVVQIAPDESVNSHFRGRFGMVEELKGFGAMIFVHLVEGETYIRLNWEQFEYIGKPAFVPQATDGDELTWSSGRPNEE